METVIDMERESAVRHEKRREGREEGARGRERRDIDKLRILLYRTKCIFPFCFPGFHQVISHQAPPVAAASSHPSFWPLKQAN
jgi:hypothetical protein